MKTKLNVFANDKIHKFLKALLSRYELTFMNLEIIDYKIHGSQANILLLNKYQDVALVNFKKLNSNYLVISNLKNNNVNLNNDLKIINTPMPIDQIKTAIENFTQNLKITFHDISINNEKLTNLNNNTYCYLTKVELEILVYLIKERETSKKFIKENILNIKSNVETNSLESHLTRIRKKMSKVNTDAKIQTKNEKLFITI